MVHSRNSIFFCHTYLLISVGDLHKSAIKMKDLVSKRKYLASALILTILIGSLLKHTSEMVNYPIPSSYFSQKTNILNILFKNFGWVFTSLSFFLMCLNYDFDCSIRAFVRWFFSTLYVFAIIRPMIYSPPLDYILL
jgi:hypothetical protein